MLRSFMLAIGLVLFLAACGGTPPATTDPTDEPTAAATDVPTDEPTVAATDVPTDTATTDPAQATTTPNDADPSASGAQTYAIVPEESQVSYEVGEVFIDRNNQYNLAVGVTQEITGNIELDLDNPQNSTVGELTINISAFQSDSTRRDDAIREQWLESTTYPIATFVPTQIDGLPETYTEGEELTLTITGDLTVREVTQPVTFEVTGKVENEEMTGAATTNIKMTDFGFDPPNILDTLKAEDDVKLIFDFVARPVA
ncbi:MAG: YceI family protein [Chloroflexales bacterium]|nr:YceI family protein [Chloroflexales bacterium]